MYINNNDSPIIFASSLPFTADEIVYLRSKIEKNKLVYIEDVLDLLASQLDPAKAEATTPAVRQMLLDEEKTHFQMDI